MHCPKSARLGRRLLTPVRNLRGLATCSQGLPCSRFHFFGTATFIGEIQNLQNATRSIFWVAGWFVHPGFDLPAINIRHYPPLGADVILIQRLVTLLCRSIFSVFWKSKSSRDRVGILLNWLDNTIGVVILWAPYLIQQNFHHRLSVFNHSH